MLKKYPFHPVLFATYPILFLYTNNISMLDLDRIFIPIAFSAIASLLIWIFLNLFIKNKYKSSIITSVFFLLFFSYGHLITVSRGFVENTFDINADLYFSVNFILVLLIVSYLIMKSNKKFLSSNAALNFIALILLVYPIFIIVRTESSKTRKQVHTLNKENNLNDDKKKPDIYYIILDGYGRSDVLRSVYGYDNENFLSELEKRGFFIARKSRANYAQTLLSLCSTLNMKYLESEEDSLSMGIYRRNLSNEISNNRVAFILKEMGYHFVTFATGYSGTEIKNSDMYITPAFSLDEFQFMLIATTPLSKLLEVIPNNSPTYLHRQRILFSINKIPEVSTQNTPMFLFAHIIAPHPPFVLNLNGESFVQLKKHILSYHDGSHYHSFNESLMREYKENYISQLKELNKLIIEMLDEIMAKEGRDKVVIIQSDHGPGFNLNWEKPSIDTFNERLPILNAYFFPNEDDILISESITPVNTFRILFNHYFNGNYEILENKSYFSTWSNPQRFICVDRYFQ